MKDEILDRVFILALAAFGISCYFSWGGSLIQQLGLGYVSFGFFSKLIATIIGTLAGTLSGSLVYIILRIVSPGYTLLLGVVGAIGGSLMSISAFLSGIA